MRYFFAKYKVDQGDIEIHYCPAVSPFPKYMMWSDVLTKPKSGRALIEDMLMLVNSPLGYIYDKDHEYIHKVSGSEKHKSFIWV